MSWGRVIATAASAVAVAGCVALAVGMSRADTVPDAIPSTLPSISAAYPHYAAPPSRSARGTTATTTPSSSAAPATTAAPSTSAAARTTTRAPAQAQPPAAPAGRALPLGFSTGNATQVVTVTSSGTWNTTATLQAWQAAPGGWLPYGPSVVAHIGSDGVSQPTSESRNATPVGSFTLTQAFGALSNPGTPLPYTKTDGSDWWISQYPSSLYNTFQSCWSGCRFTTTGDKSNPNEHLYYETPYYNYAVVIDYNTANAGPVIQGAGSAFFLHVYPPGTGPTAGCVAIPQANLIQIMQWLNPAAHPRILIGVG